MTDSENSRSLPRLTKLAHEIVAAVLPPGGTAIDATAGNGHDTLFLAQRVGPAGRVFAFDIQKDAIATCEERMRRAGLSNVTFLKECHSQMARTLDADLGGKVNAVMFNLGYLPGGDKTLITDESKTVSAISDALELLAEEGVVTVLAYRGHPGGREEADAVAGLLASFDQSCFEISLRKVSGAPETSPELSIIRKQADL